MKYTKDDSFTESLDKGFLFYINTFFTNNGTPKYYDNSIYPIDIHSSAQLIITLSHLNKSVAYNSLIEKVLNWTIDHMQSDKGFFYYQINRHFTSKIPYMRWSQAWMFYAFSEFFLQKVPVLVKTSV